jgi:uncharacterized protein YbjT (DUF2867 family)
MSERVLLIGSTGHLGRHFVTALREAGKEVLALLRPETVDGAAGGKRELIETFKRDGVQILKGELVDEAALDRACSSAGAVVSCIDHRPDRLKLQAGLVRAAARTGRIGRFVPSQFGIDSRTYGQSRVEHGDAKRDLQQLFNSSGVPVTYVHANGLASFWAASLGQLGLAEPPRERIDVYGDGNVKFSIVTPEDVAYYTVRTLDDVRTKDQHTTITPPENLLTQNELIAIWESKTKVKLQRHTVSAAELDSTIAGLAGKPEKFRELSMMQLVRAAWIDGLGDGKRLPDVLELAELYPDLQYQRITSYLDRFAAISQAAE